MEREFGDIGDLVCGIAVVKFEHDHIALSAVDARVRLEVAIELTPILFTPRLDLRHCTTDVIRSVGQVVRAT